jgi:hypothetical protein
MGKYCDRIFAAERPSGLTEYVSQATEVSWQNPTCAILLHAATDLLAEFLSRPVLRASLLKRMGV